MRARNLGLFVTMLGGIAASISCQTASPDPLALLQDGKVIAAAKAAPPFDSGVLPLVGQPATQTFVIAAPPPSETDVSLGFIVSADLSAPNEYFTIKMNGRDLGRLFELYGLDCGSPAQEAEFVVPAETYNTALQEDGQIEIQMTASADVNLAQCANGYIRVIVDYCGSGPCPRANPVPGAPRVVSAISTSNTSVLVTFNEPVYEGAGDPSHYSIVQANVNSESAALKVLAADRSQDMTEVTLTTASQNEVTYELIVTGIQDLAGNVISPPDILVNPTRTQFAGTPAIDGGPDEDKDGLSDALEQNGWVVNIRRISGDIDTLTVTSDTTLEDTDGDGVTDLDEYRNRSNPRQKDTDGDTLTDGDEWNIIYSDMTDQDSDEDGIDDGLEVGLYKTSPTVADTDGDGLSDSRETIELFRDPRIADLPRPRIVIGQVRLSLDERYTFVNEQGETTSVESSSSSALAQSDSTKYSSSDSDTTGSAREAYIKGNVEGVISKDPSLTIGAEGGYKWNWSDSHTSQFSSESSSEVQETYEESLSKGRQFSRNSQVTREVVGAELSVDVTVEDAGEIAFSISNIEITVLQRSQFSLTDYVPIATLVPASQLLTGDNLVLTLGPLVPSRGPLVFSNREIFPKLVEDLMSSPRGLIFKIANFDITDEFGRNFAFASQEARDRGAGLVIDRGDGVPERVLTALNGQLDDAGIEGGGYIGGFDGRGRPLGLTMDYVLQDVLGYEKNREDPDGIVAGADFMASTHASGDDVQVVPAGTAGLLPHDVIVAAGPNGVLDSNPQGDDEPEVISGYETSRTCSSVTPERVIEPLQDGDGIASTLALDDDVQVIPFGTNGVAAGATIISAGPDGVLDSFTDGDDRAIFPGQTGTPHQIVEPTGGNGRANTTAQGDDVQLIALNAVAAAGAVIIGPGPNGVIDTLAGGDDLPISRDCGNFPINGREVLVRFESRRSGDFQRVWMVLVDRNIPPGGDFGTLRLKPGDDISIAFLQDQDRDGLLAQEEFQENCSDVDDDSDNDALDDFVEVRVGWDVGVQGGTGLIVSTRPDPSRIDSDGDGIPDWYEQDIRRLFKTPGGTLPAPNPANLSYIPTAQYAGIFGVAWTDPTVNFANIKSTNPRLADSDSDGISDKDELFGYTVGLSIRAGANNLCNTEALGDDVQKVLVGQQAYNPGNANGGVVILPGPNLVIDSSPLGGDVLDTGSVVRTNPLNPDHDGDTRFDGRERDLGGNPTSAGDSDDFLDTDLDGLSDAEEAILGWTVNIQNPSCTPTTRNVKSNKFVPDTDLDGLPDLLERLIGSDPTREDSDCDGLRDYDEFAAFGQYIELGLIYPGFVLNGTNSARYGTSPTDSDSDNDTLSDSFEINTGWRVFAAGFSAPRDVRPNPAYADTDLDGSTDAQEFARLTDPNDPDTDDDGTIDGVDGEPLGPNITVDVAVRSWLFDNIGSNCTGETGSRWTWSFTAYVNSPDGYDLFSNNHVSCTEECHACVFGDSVISSGFSTNRYRTLSLRPGDLLVVEGSMSNVRASCNSLCDRMDLLEVWSYDTLIAGDSAVISVVDVRGQVGSLEGEVEIRIRVDE